MKESHIRDLEDRHLLSPWRSKDTTGQRQYSPSELEKLAVIKELLDQGPYTISQIPENIADLQLDTSAPAEEHLSSRQTRS
jgi:DNA-binding transcriptional MerR regulator